MGAGGQSVPSSHRPTVRADTPQCAATTRKLLRPRSGTRIALITSESTTPKSRSLTCPCRRFPFVHPPPTLLRAAAPRRPAAAKSYFVFMDKKKGRARRLRNRIFDLLLNPFFNGAAPGQSQLGGNRPVVGPKTRNAPCASSRCPSSLPQTRRRQPKRPVRPRHIDYRHLRINLNDLAYLLAAVIHPHEVSALHGLARVFLRRVPILCRLLRPVIDSLIFHVAQVSPQ